MKQILLSEKTEFKLTLKDFLAITFLMATVVGMYFSLKAEINVAKQLPKFPITEEELKYKDEIVSNAIINTQKDISEIKESIKLLEQRVYERK